MGNSSSTSANADSSSASAPDITGFEVTLSDRFQQQILQDFNAKVHGEWMQRRQQQQAHQQANNELAQQHQQFVQAKQANIQATRKQLAAMSSKFDEKILATDSAASRLHEKYVKAPEILGNEAPCAEVRNNYIACQQSSPPGACTIYIQALQDCVTDTLGGK